MGSGVSKLKHDGGAHRQLLALFLVATLLMAFELGFFVRIVLPQVRSGLAEMLRNIREKKLAELIDKENPATKSVTAVLGVLHEREQEHIKFTNRTAMINGCLLVVLAAILSATVLGASQRVRNEPKKHVFIDIGFTFLLLAMFQVVFYYYGQRWVYTSDAEHLVNVMNAYEKDGDATANLQAQAPELLQPDADVKVWMQRRATDSGVQLLVEQLQRIDPAITRDMVLSLFTLLQMGRLQPEAAKRVIITVTRQRVTAALLDLLIRSPPNVAADALFAFVALQQLMDIDTSTLVTLLELLGKDATGQMLTLWQRTGVLRKSYHRLVRAAMALQLLRRLADAQLVQMVLQVLVDMLVPAAVQLRDLDDATLALIVSTAPSDVVNASLGNMLLRGDLAAPISLPNNQTVAPSTT